jgi:hypothetical protein
MGPPPSPRFGLSLTVIQNKIYVFGGDSVGTKNEDSAHMFILDCCKVHTQKRRLYDLFVTFLFCVAKIKYPPEPETSESETSNIDRVRNSTTTTSTSNSNVTKTELLHSSIETAEQKVI